MSKKGFILLNESSRFVRRLTNEQAGRLFKLIYDYHEGKEVKIDDDIATEWEMFEFMFDVLKREQAEKTQQRAEVNRRYYSSHIKTLRHLKTFEETESETEKRTKKEKDKEKEDKKETIHREKGGQTTLYPPEETKKRFQKPTVAEVHDYAQTLGYVGFDAQHFWDFYESKGWVVGKAPMKDWRRAVANWQRTQEQKRKEQQQRQQKWPTGNSMADRAYRMLHFAYEDHPEMWAEEARKVKELGIGI